MTKRLAAAVVFALVGAALTWPGVSLAQDGEIIRDGEYYVLEAQHGDRWKQDDIVVDSKLAEIRENNNDKPPNILYILIDDVGFGEVGNPDLNYVRGTSTPRINALAEECLSFMRIYTEPSCTPTRVALMTGRHPVRTGMGEVKVALVGEGLGAEEVPIAEVLSKAGYNTAHVGKWHMGDIQEAYPHNQGFDVAYFPLHQLALWTNSSNP